MAVIQASPTEVSYPPVYIVIGLALAPFAGGATFLTAWALFGWLPALILALFVGGATVILWAPAAIVLLPIALKWLGVI
jgi:hypothetical protein